MRTHLEFASQQSSQEAPTSVLTGRPPPPLLQPTPKLNGTRRLLPVAWGLLTFEQTVGSFTKLMGKGEAASRRELMELHGDTVEVDV